MNTLNFQSTLKGESLNDSFLFERGKHIFHVHDETFLLILGPRQKERSRSFGGHIKCLDLTYLYQIKSEETYMS